MLVAGIKGTSSILALGKLKPFSAFLRLRKNLSPQSSSDPRCHPRAAGWPAQGTRSHSLDLGDAVVLLTLNIRLGILAYITLQLRRNSEERLSNEPSRKRQRKIRSWLQI